MEEILLNSRPALYDSDAGKVAALPQTVAYQLTKTDRHGITGARFHSGPKAGQSVPLEWRDLTRADAISRTMPRNPIQPNHR